MDHDVGAFYRHEISYREFFHYPPFTRMIKVIFRHQEEEKAVQAAIRFAEALGQMPVAEDSNRGGISVQGPVPGIIPRLRSLYVQELWLKCPRDVRVLDTVKAFLKELRGKMSAQKGLGNVQVVIDVDPV
jgi:primosomal protein N' (replication factor Y)